MSTSFNRRDFMKRTALAGIGLSLQSGLGALAQQPAPSRPAASPNEKIRVAVIGTNGRGIAHIQCLAGIRGVEISHICDVDDRAIAKGIQETAKGQKSEPKGLKDFRKALEDKSLDAITIATPDHWHAPMAILGLQAGKHVYVEKPCSHNPHESELLVQAQKKYGKLVQMGTQQRSSPHTIDIVKKIHEGLIGKAYLGKAWYSNTRKSIGVGK